MTAFLRRWLWPTSVACGAAAAVALALPGVAHAEVMGAGELRFTFSQAAILVALGAAWGDMRMRVSNIEKKLEQLEQNTKGDK